MERSEQRGLTAAMTDLLKLLRPFGISVFAKATALRDLGPDLSAAQKSRLRESISDDIKKCSNFVPRSVSKGAQERAIRLPGAGPEVDLAAQSWHEQHAFDPGREIFHFEHMTPVSAVREACLIAVSADEVAVVLASRIRVAWILKDEDLRLTKNGHRSKRPDPETAYREAGIDLIESEGRPSS